MREVLPLRRHAETFSLSFGGQHTVYAVTLGYYDDGRLGEVFITGAKAGTEMASLTRDGAILISLALQHGASMATIQHAISRNEKKEATSIIGAVIDKITEHKNV